MARAIENWTKAVGSLLSLAVLCSLAACKKRDEPAPAASVPAAVEQAAASAALAQAAAAASAAQASAAAASAPTTPAASATPTLGQAKRFPEKEKAASGSTKVALDASKVYDEPDATSASVASLPKDLVVTRLATLGSDWVLVEFPSGVGKVSPGWIEAKSLLGPSPVGAKPATSASAAALASAKPATTAAASAAPAPSASAPKVRVKPGVLRAPGR